MSQRFIQLGALNKFLVLNKFLFNLSMPLPIPTASGGGSARAQEGVAAARFGDCRYGVAADHAACFLLCAQFLHTHCSACMTRCSGALVPDQRFVRVCCNTMTKLVHETDAKH